MTGSVNQFGEVQPVGGVNEKIEGFFDACEILGLENGQAVILPATNVQHLMLNSKVRDAIKKKQFSDYAVKTVDEALNLVTSTHPGKKQKNGQYPPSSLYGRILAKFEALRESNKDD